MLQGLMDTDGSVIVGGHVEFCTTRQALADGVFELAVSLGHKPVKRAERARIEGRDVGPRWRVTWSPRHQVFRLARKATAVRMTTTQANRTAHRYIVACEQVPSVPVRCIAVDSPSHLFLAGRTMIPTHNTRSAAEWSKTRMLGEPKHRLGIVVPRFADGRDVCVEGESGLLSVLPDDRVKDWNRSLGELKLANGSIARIYAADTEKSAETLRGPQFHSLWYEELANQRYGPVAWDLGMMALRLGSDPRVCVSTTPKPTKLIKELVVDPQVHVTRGSTYDNAANLPAVILERLRAKYEGTTIGRQELHAEVLDDIEGALFTLDLIERARILESGCPEMDRIVVAVDPATTSTAQSDETGVVVVGQHADQLYVLADLSGTYTPSEWATVAVQAYYDSNADRIVAETNQGGDMVETVVRQVRLPDGRTGRNVPYRKVTATRGKVLRAEPVQALYEQRRVHHVGHLAELESQMTTWVPGTNGSPDRLDALVWGVSALAFKQARTLSFAGTA
ncbi:terminase large subunit domain-containing protein [Fodinicola feengrottensis]|uniref:phage terminase large subunit family protein n=1 Tax=Fodinicola feengrottensis TaxID=435914 RepID=UPI0031D2AC69